MAEQDLTYRVENHVATVTINRESRRNAISPGALALFHEALDRALADDAVRVGLRHRRRGKGLLHRRRSRRRHGDR